MTRIYLTTPGMVGRKRGGRLEVDQDGQTVLRAPLAQVEQVVVVGRGAQLTTALLVELMRRGVRIAFVSRSGRYYGQAAAALSGSATARAAQYAFLTAAEPSARFVAAVVRQKLAGQIEVLRSIGGLPAAIDRMGLLAEAATGTNNIDRIRGHEGAAAALYWQAVRQRIPPGWKFPGRRAHPPPDPVNAALSLAYTLLLQELVSAVHVVGLDPALGALHTPQADRPSLALDLEEVYRPLGVDAWVVEAFLTGALAVGHFTSERGASRLDASGRKVFLALYERGMAKRVRHPLAQGRITQRQSLELEVRMAGHLFQGDRPTLDPIEWR